MSISTRTFDYEIEGKTYEAFVASPEGGATRPAVMVFHTWAGHSPLENERAKGLAKLGYTGIAMDLYGKGVLGTSKEENEKLLTPFVSDREMLKARLLANIDAVKKETNVGNEMIAAIGYCFGGLCVLDIARANTGVAGVVSFHGLLGAPGNTAAKINSKVLALHGWDDPMAPPSDVEAFSKEMNAAKADWQLHAYGGTMHAFTHPEANDPDFGTVYDADADRRSWQAMANFLEEIFA